MLPAISAEQLAIVRLDADIYESTMQALTADYPRALPGGFASSVITVRCRDTAGASTSITLCTSITEPVEQIERAGVFWRRS